MTNIYNAYLELNPKNLQLIRAMFFNEFGVAETTLQNFLKGIAKPKNKYVKFFSILFDLKENLSPIVMDEKLSREYKAFEYKEFKTEAKTKVDAIFTPKEKKVKPKVGLREQARANQAKSRSVFQYS